jgi:uncharacterized protein YpmB
MFLDLFTTLHSGWRFYFFCFIFGLFFFFLLIFSFFSFWATAGAEANESSTEAKQQQQQQNDLKETTDRLIAVRCEQRCELSGFSTQPKQNKK